MKIINSKESKQLVDEITIALADHGEVKVTGLGIFTIKDKKERQGRNPRTGAAITTPAGKKLKFKASFTLKKEVI